MTIQPNLPVILEDVLNKAAADVDDFDWITDDSVIIPRQPAIAVYFNKCDEIVIRQGADYPDEDRFVYVRRENLAPLIHRLQEIERGA
jgi:hypothetical protein